MTKEDVRINVARSSMESTIDSSEAAYRRLEAVLDVTEGVPVREISGEDSMAVAIEDVKREHQESLTRTERSRRAYTRG